MLKCVISRDQKLWGTGWTVPRIHRKSIVLTGVTERIQGGEREGERE